MKILQYIINFPTLECDKISNLCLICSGKHTSKEVVSTTAFPLQRSYKQEAINLALFFKQEGRPVGTEPSSSQAIQNKYQITSSISIRLKRKCCGYLTNTHLMSEYDKIISSGVHSRKHVSQGKKIAHVPTEFPFRGTSGTKPSPFSLQSRGQVLPERWRLLGT